MESLFIRNEKHDVADDDVDDENDDEKRDGSAVNVEFEHREENK